MRCGCGDVVPETVLVLWDSVSIAYLCPCGRRWSIGAEGDVKQELVKRECELCGGEGRVENLGTFMSEYQSSECPDCDGTGFREWEI